MEINTSPLKLQEKYLLEAIYINHYEIVITFSCRPLYLVK